jgi:DNA repair exonuclease SbcCD ATPase subunit
MNNTKFAQWFYWISIGVLVATAIGIVWRLIILPPDLKGLDVVGLASSVLGVAATVLAILGAVAVAAWWVSLDEKVTKRVNELYKKQEEKIDEKVKEMLKQQERKINDQIVDFREKLQIIENNAAKIQKDLEETLAESFAATGPFLSESALQRAMSQGKLPAFPYFMVKSYIAQFKTQIPRAEATLSDVEHTFHDLQSFVNRDFPLNQTGITEMTTRKNILLDLYKRLDTPYSFSSVTESIDECDRAVDLLRIARNNREKTPNLTDQDFSQVQNDLDGYCAKVEKMKQDIEKMKTDINLLIPRINNYLQQEDSDKTP